MRVALTGATGVIGKAVVPTLVDAGHDVVALARTSEKADQLTRMGATPVRASLQDHAGLVALFDDADAVCNFATHVPVGLAALRRGAWRVNDRLRTEGVRRVVEAAREAGVRRIVQESVSFVYADAGDEWVTEESPVAITRATEPASVGESHVQGYACDSRTGVVLRLGTIVGDDPLTRFQLRALRHGMAIGLGSPDGWAHVMHTDDLGPAVIAALAAPSGVYNVGSEPVRRFELVAGFSAAAGRESIDFMGPLMRRVGGVRLEPLARSLRVSSERLTGATGWEPQRAKFDSTWFEGLPSREAV
ncbi:MAG: NAD(P)-dependent oxidoreductase [Nocardioidaceae bacterium]|nr:NAD(P)-dependent oxidoreductase [Nocardioidaceae bacterium]